MGHRHDNLQPSNAVSPGTGLTFTTIVLSSIPDPSTHRCRQQNEMTILSDAGRTLRNFLFTVVARSGYQLTRAPVALPASRPTTAEFAAVLRAVSAEERAAIRSAVDRATVASMARTASSPTRVSAI